MTWVFDATPLIYLAKAERLGIIETLEEPRLVPNRVYSEVVTDGIEEGYTDARRIERHVEAGLLDVVDVEESPIVRRLERNPDLSDADIAVLACADEQDAIAVLDEAAGRSVAEVEGIETRGTGFIVLSAVSRGEITRSEGREAIDTMVESGWYVAPELYGKILAKLESFGE